MKKFVIYSAIIGKYDDINQPSIIDDRFDYILFSNDFTQGRIGIWQIRPIKYHNDIQTKIARWVKTHPEELLPEYQCCLWIDANIDIKDIAIYERVIDLFNKKILISSMVHLKRNCIYDEMITVLQSKLETEDCILKWGHQLRENDYPRNNGLFETGVLFRNHQKKQTILFDKLWWQCIKQYSRRDQLSFNYILWKLKIECAYFLSDKENVRNSPLIHINNHSNATHRTLNITNWRETRLMRFIYYYPYEKLFNIFYWTYSLPFTLLSAKIIGLLIGIKNKIKRIIVKQR